MSDSTRDGHGRGDGHRRRQRHQRRERKERVLHTRISDDLAEDLRRMAEDLRVPVSNIVRTVLEEAFSVVEKVTDNVGDLIEEVVDEAEAARERIRRRHEARRAARTRDADDETATVIGWQPLILAGPRRCSVCQLPLAAGAQAWASVTTRGIGGEIRCERCVRDGGRQPGGPAARGDDGDAV